LFSVGDDRGSRRLEALDGVADRLLVERFERGIVRPETLDRVDETWSSGDAADRFSR
jgi:hypothetical protein